MKIDFSKIQHQKLKTLLNTHGIREVADLKKIDVKRNLSPESKEHSHFAVFSVNAPCKKVWAAYKSINPKDAWAGKIFDFAMLYCQPQKSVYYPSDTEFPSAEAGQHIFLHLNLAKGLAKVLVGHKLVRVDEELMELETNYLENSASQGSQVIRVVANGPDKTVIEHQTYYSSGSWFRDKVLYPPLHQLIIAQFHKNVRNYLANQATSQPSI